MCIDSENGNAPIDERIGRVDIQGGHETNYATFMGVVAISAPNGGICTGVLIHPSIVLSAAHCVFAPSLGLSETPGVFKVYGGSNLNEQVYRIFYSDVAEAVTHPEWDGAIDSFEDVDLSLLLLETPVTSLETYKINTSHELASGDTGIIVGYGEEVDGGVSSHIHKTGQTTVLGFNQNYIEVGDPATAAQGDSGGPFFVLRESHWVVAGIVSFNDESLEESSWVIDVSSYRDWIETEKKSLLSIPPDSNRGNSGCTTIVGRHRASDLIPALRLLLSFSGE